MREAYDDAMASPTGRELQERVDRIRAKATARAERKPPPSCGLCISGTLPDGERCGCDLGRRDDW